MLKSYKWIGWVGWDGRKSLKALILRAPLCGAKNRPSKLGKTVLLFGR